MKKFEKIRIVIFDLCILILFFCGNSIFSRTTTLENLLLLFFSGVVQIDCLVEKRFLGLFFLRFRMGIWG